MEVTVIETGNLPSSTIISFHTGSVRRHAQMEKNKAISLSNISSSEPVRVDLTTQIGSHTFDMVPGQEIYDVPITPGEAGVKLKFRIREAAPTAGGCENEALGVDGTGQMPDGDDTTQPGSPSRKLQTALMMRSYLDNHDVLEQMQELLQDMVTHRPEDPIDYMIQRLEQVCRDSQGVDIDMLDGDIQGVDAASPFKLPPKDGKDGEKAAGSDTEDKPAYEGFAAPGTEKPKEQPKEEAHDEDHDSDDGEGHEQAEKALERQAAAGPRRREGVSAEAMKGDDSSWTPPVYDKTAEERSQLSDIIKHSKDSKLHMLFGNVSKTTFEQILDAMQLMKIKPGQNVIEQGGVGDFFYIVKNGDFDIFVKKGQDPPKKVFEAGEGFAFGELALLYNAPRTATISASLPAEVWALDRTAFRNLVVRSAEAQFRMQLEFLEKIDIFTVLTENERASLAEVLEEEEFEDDEAIVEQGEKDDKMFILRRGAAVACIKGEQGEVEVMRYEVGSYFGEIALLSGEPRKASVYAQGETTCLYITRATFLRVLGSLSSILERNMTKYSKYAEAMASADVDTDPADASANHKEEDDDKHEEMEALGSNVKQKVVHRKRERKSDKQENVGKVKQVIKEEREPETLADKVAQDFKNPALVTPAVEFEVPGTQMMLYGGLVPGQKFTMDKLIYSRGGVPPIEVDGVETFTWSGQTKLKSNTQIDVVSQKGQKSASDPTPNQDNVFVHQKDGISMYGVADGHGPFGHLVSFRLVQTLPWFLTQRQAPGKDWELILKEAFLDAQADLCKFCAEHTINIEASGAAGSVLVLEEQTIHIAFIGDARVMVGSWNRRDARMIFCSKDHKPGDPPERQRLELAGSEVREVDPGNFRIYLPGSTFPGLTMSRAFGDTACAGVLREPEYHKILMQPTDQWYALVASDGVWEHMEGEEVYNLTAKKLRLKGPRETLNFLVGASRKRWQYCCGDYCDDISGLLVQWNTPESKDSKKNHAMTVKGPDGEPVRHTAA